MADSVGVKQQNWARWESGVVSPSADMIIKICRAHACSADWLLGLPERGGGGMATARGEGAIAAVGNATVNAGGVCSKCRLMQAHIREISGRG